MGYHTKEIEKGVLGEFSKIKEEFLELEDGYEQGNKLLMLCEIADLLGAISAYIKKYNLDLEDILKMTRATESAFQEGSRT